MSPAASAAQEKFWITEAPDEVRRNPPDEVRRFRREVRGRPKAPFRDVYFKNYILQCKIMRLPIIDFRSCTSDEHFEKFPEDYSDVYKTKPFLQLDFLIMYMPF